MVIYVRLESNEAIKSRNALFDLKNKVEKVHSKALDFNKFRAEKKRNSFGLVTKINEIKNELEKIKALLPKVEPRESEEELAKKIKVKAAQLKEKKGKKGYAEQLEELRKKIAELT